MVFETQKEGERGGFKELEVRKRMNGGGSLNVRSVTGI